MFDIFYSGKKPGLFAHEREADSIEHAQQLSRTRFFWWVTYLADLSEWDFLWEPVPWQAHQRHAWPSQHQVDAGVYLVPKTWSGETNYRTDQTITRLSSTDNWTVPGNIDPNSFDFSWHPDYREPAYEYHFPSQWQTASGVTYTVPGAQEVKLVDAFCVRAVSNPHAWTNTDNIVYFDFSWHPNVLDPGYIYEFGTQWYDEGGPVYTVTGAVDRKYVDSPRAQLKGTTENWHVLHPIDRASFNWSWQPHPKDPAYIYVWGNNYWPAEKMPTIEYHVSGATERKYMEDTAKLAACYDNWEIPDLVTRDSVNYTWVPDPQDPPYIYEFATQWQHNGGARYVVPGATETKYIEQGHRRTADMAPWVTAYPVEAFDYSWHPSNTEEPYIYVFGNQHYPGTIMPTVRYVMPGATTEKFVDAPVAKLAESRLNWEILEPIDETTWDWTWRPNPVDPPYIYVFGNQWNPAEYKASVRYIVPEAQEVKYMEQLTTRLPNYGNQWQVNIDTEQFDYSWEPNPFDPPMNYVFGNQWNPGVIEPTIVYQVPGATETKYIDELIATVAPVEQSFKLLDTVELFDYSWRPNPTDPPYIYVFGNQWYSAERMPTIEYHVAGATERKYMPEPVAQLQACHDNKWHTLVDCEWDYSWRPDPGDVPYIYVWGNQHWPAEIMPTVEYHVPGARERKYMTEHHARLLAHDNWTTVTTVPFEFDRSWVPDPGDPPFVYVFGNQWHPAEEMSTIEYHIPGANERKFVDSIHAKLLPAMDRWSIPEEVNADNIDFSWHPHAKEHPYIHHFGSDYQMSIGLTYTVPGATELKFAGDPPLKVAEKKAVVVQDIFYMDRSNALSQQRFVELQLRYPHIQKIRYVNSIQDTVKRCLTKTKQNRFWVVGSENDYSEFDFAWHAQPWQSSMTHVFGSQWNKWSDTFLINRWEFERHAKWAKSIEEFPNLNFVQDRLVHAPADAHDIYVIDFGNLESADVVANLESRYRVVKKARYFDNYLDTFKRLLDGVTAEHVWIVGSVCDYSTFDFSWQPEAWQRDMLHVFPSNDQKFGDTFFVPVQKLREKIAELELLDWFDTVNYCTDQTVARWPMPIIQHQEDSQVTAVLSSEWAGPFALFTNKNYITGNLVTVPLWREKVKSIVPLDTGASSVIVPKSAVPYIKTQLYDYPNIDKSHRILKGEPLDIVFMSNGEPNADLHFSHLNSVTYNLENRLHRVDGVNGRIASQRAAAQAATTEWYFVVPAKLEVDLRFDWAWQPDRMQQAKHYIFHALNPVNGLVYGHQATVAYNKKLVLETTGNGLDFTMEKAHEVVPIMSGVANYTESPWVAWRTAFREVIKLQHSLPDVESEYRLKQWLATPRTNVDNWAWSVWGAEDAVEYYKEVQGDVNALMKSYEWSWLASYAFLKRGITTVE